MRKQKISLVLLAVAIFGIIGIAAVSAGASSQYVEYEHGANEKVYPIFLVPRPGECGSDKDDIILQYNTYWGPRVNPDNVRWSSDLWWVRSYISGMYQSGLSANGLGTETTRVCMGTKGMYLGNNLYYLYLWHK